jgi:hypothetical protein
LLFHFPVAASLARTPAHRLGFGAATDLMEMKKIPPLPKLTFVVYSVATICEDGGGFCGRGR